MKRDFLVELKVNFEMETPLGFSDCTVSESCCQYHKLRDIETVERFVSLYKKAITNKKINHVKIELHYCYFNPHIDNVVFSNYAYNKEDLLSVNAFKKTYIDVVNGMIENIDQWEIDQIDFVA